MRDKRFIGCMVFLVITMGLYAQSSSSVSTGQQGKAEPYTPEEFPQWALDLRRADIIAFGTLPFTMFFTTFAIDSYRCATHDWDRRYAPWPFKATGSIEMSESQRITAFKISIASSVFLSVVDYFIYQHQRKARKGTTIDTSALAPHINYSPWPDTSSSSSKETDGSSESFTDTTVSGEP